MQITNLVFQGGGVKGIAYAGAIEVLQQKNILSGIRHVAGTSAGSITAALLALGADSNTIQNILTHTTFTEFMDGKGLVFGDSIRLFESYGIYKGDTFVSWFEQQAGEITKRLLGTAQPEITFKQLADLAAEHPGKFFNLYVITTNLSKQLPEIFSADTYPDVAISKALRMSMSIPFFFEAVPFNGDFYVDGGVSWNYPIDLFDGNCEQPVVGRRTNISSEAHSSATLGFSLGTQQEITSEQKDWTPLPIAIHNLESFIKGLFAFWLNESNRLHLDKSSLNRTVFIDNANVPTTDFKIAPTLVQTLIANGRSATQKYLVNR